MKKLIALTAVIFSAVCLFSQIQSAADLDRETAVVAEGIIRQTTGKGNIIIETGSFSYSGLETPLGNYWRQNLISILSGNLTVLAPGSRAQGDCILSGEIIDFGQSIRIYTRLTDKASSAILVSLTSDLGKAPYLNNLIVTDPSKAPVISDAYEEDSRGNPVPVAIGDAALSRTIHRRDDQDWFLIRSETSFLGAMETSGSLDTVMELYDEGRNKLAENDDGGEGENARIDYYFEGGKSYIAMVRGYGSSDTGHYQFSVRTMEIPDQDMEPNNTLNTAFRTELGNTIRAYLMPGDEDWYSFSLNSAVNVLLFIRGLDDAQLFLYDSSGRELSKSTGSRGNARIFSALENGMYYITVRGNNRNTIGRYTLHTRIREQGGDAYEPDDTAELAKEIKVGETQHRNFIDGEDVDWAFFYVETVGTYQINTRGVLNDELDTYLELLDQNQRQIAANDDSDAGFSSHLHRKLSPGKYFLRISCLDNNPNDDYILSLSRD